MPETRTTARRVRLSYPEDLSSWGRTIVEGRPFRAYLRRAHETAEPGAVWEEFVDVGCCGDTMDVAIHVESVEGGSRLDEETEFEFEAREDADHEGCWRVQSAAGPRR